MPRASRKIINKHLEEELNQSFSYIISILRDRNEINTFLEYFMTAEEKKMLPKRLMLHIMLLNQVSDSEISSHLGMSYETIRTYKNSLNSMSEEYKKKIRQVLKRKEMNELLNKLNKKTERLDNFLKAKSSMKARAKVFSRN